MGPRSTPMHCCVLPKNRHSRISFSCLLLPHSHSESPLVPFALPCRASIATQPYFQNTALFHLCSKILPLLLAPCIVALKFRHNVLETVAKNFSKILIFSIETRAHGVCSDGRLLQYTPIKPRVRLNILFCSCFWHALVCSTTSHAPNKIVPKEIWQQKRAHSRRWPNL